MQEHSEFMALDARIFVAGHRGLVGSAIVRALTAAGYSNLLTRTRTELDLEDAAAVRAFFAHERPHFVFLAAAKVGGILANNTFPADFIRANLTIQNNVIESAREAGVKRLLFLGSSCIYPKYAPQPITEGALLTGSLELTNRPYAIAKIAGVETCWAYNRQFGTRFLAAMPTNLYGANDNFDLNNSHVLPALIRKAADAVASGSDNFVVWGTGLPRRELMHADDMASACVFLMNLSEPHFDQLLPSDEPPLINIGTGEDLSIQDLAELVATVVGFKGKLIFDISKPDGTPRKLMDVSRLSRLGWSPSIPLEVGIRRTVVAWMESRRSADLAQPV